MELADHVIHAKWLISGKDESWLENHSLIVKNTRIADILPTQQAHQKYQSDDTHYYLDHVVMPGFVNAHTHLGMNFFRGLADDLQLMTWLNQHMFPAEKKWLSHEFVFDASLMAMAEMIKSGTTCFNDMFYFIEATAQAAQIAQMRANIGIHVLDFETNWTKTPEECLERGEVFYQQYINHPLINVTMAPHAPYTLCDKTFIQVLEFAKAHHLKINIHIHETQDEIQQSLQKYQKRPIKRLDDLGFLSSDVIAMHMVHINSEDMAIIEKTRPQVVHCPESNMKLASGTCSIHQFKALGINVALGTDSVASNNDLNMLGEMRSAAFLAKHSTHNTEVLPAFEAIQLGTLHGARALGLDHEFGSLEVGKAADFIAIDMNQIETLPVYHPISQVVYSTARHQVSDVWVAGKQLMKNRQLLTLDEAALKEKAMEWGLRIQREGY